MLEEVCYLQIWLALLHTAFDSLMHLSARMYLQMCPFLNFFEMAMNVNYHKKYILKILKNSMKIKYLFLK